MSDSSDTQKGSGEPAEHRFVRQIAFLLCAFMVFTIGIWFGVSGNLHSHIAQEQDVQQPAPLKIAAPNIPAPSLAPASAPGEAPASAPGAGTQLTARSFSDIFKRAAPTVVTVETSQYPLGQTNSGQSRKMVASGLIISPDGYILTVNHMLAPGSQIKVTMYLNPTRTTLAKVVGVDTFTDLAVLKTTGEGLPVASFGDSNQLHPGDWVAAIGSPFGFQLSITHGIVSAVGRSLDDLNNHAELIQTDAGLNSGNAGGPLLNLNGEVVGIVIAVRGRAQAISFACPITVARNVATQLMEKGSIPRPFLGLYMDNVDPVKARALNLPVTTGVLVHQAIRGGPCERAGIKDNDIIQSVDGIPATSVKQVREIIATHKPDDVMTFTVRRQSGTETRKVNVGSYSY